MAFERVGLGANLIFNAKQAIGAMGRAGAAFRKLASAGKQVGQGLSQIGGAARGGAIALAPLTIGMGLGIKTAGEFESQMSVVKSILGKGFDPALEAKIKQLGATTQFSATQAAQGAEFLSRAGFTAQQQIAALGPTLAAAAADGIPLATAADIVASNVRAFGLEAEQAGRVADVLAITSAKTNTDMTQLAEGMKYAAPIARQLGQSIEDTSASLGLMANAGIKGSAGGTALKNMMTKLAGASDATKQKLNDMGVKVQDANGNMLPMFRVVQNLTKGLAGVKGNMKQTAFLTETFGLRGQAAAGNLVAAFEKMNKTGKDGRNEWNDLIESIQNSKGAAEQMAKVRMDNFFGSLTLLKSAAEGLTIEAFGPMLGTLKGGIQAITAPLSDLAVALQHLNNPTKATEEQFGKMSGTIIAVAKGMFSAFTTIREVITMVGNKIAELKDRFKSSVGSEQLQKIAKMATLFLAAGAAIAPILAALGGLSMFISSVIVPGLVGIGTVIAGVFSAIVSPAGLVILALVGLFYLFRDQVTQIWMGLKTVFMPVIESLKYTFMDLFNTLKTAFGAVMMIWSDGLTTNQTDWVEVGRTVGSVIGAIVTSIAQVIAFVIQLASYVAVGAAFIGKALYDNVVFYFQWIGQLLGGLGASVAALFSGQFVEAIRIGGQALLDFILEPIRLIIKAMIKLADAVPGAGSLVPDSLRSFASGGLQAKLAPSPGPANTNAMTASQRAQGDARADSESRREKENKGLKDAMGKQSTTVNVNNQLQIDGREVAFSVANHKAEIAERAGKSATPWQRTATRAGA